MYGKIFESIYEGTLCGKWEAIVTFQQMIVLCNADGEIEMTPEAISAKTTIPLDIIKKGIKVLESPDPYSRTPGEEGRRIVLLDESRPWGWRIVNHKLYRNKGNHTNRREYMREYMRNRRKK